MGSWRAAECKRCWDTAGWCVIEDVIPPNGLAGAQDALPAVFPTAAEFADGATRTATRRF
jgi:hypothetical protein